jgi:aerobic C4-dicarboxylate transport protein
VLLLGVDWFMATCRALTNMIGNAVACIVVAKWENSVDTDRMHAVLDGRYLIVDADEPDAGLILGDAAESPLASASPA